MKRITVLLIVVMVLSVLLTICSSPAMASYDSRVFSEALDNLRASGKLSNDEITYAFVDLNFIEKQGTVTAAVYESVYEYKTINQYEKITPQTPDSCTNKLTRFVFELTNRYRPETSLAIQIHYDDLTVSVWTHGEYKNQAMLAFVSGIPDCLKSEPYSRDSKDEDSSSWVDDYSPEAVGTDPVESFQVTQVTTFKINNTSYTSTVITENEETEEANTMDVEPYIKNNRTYVPVRYLAYALGVSEGGISWDGKAQRVGIFKGENNIALTIGSNAMLASGKTVIMDVPPEITKGRTMLPARWVAEALGAEVEWDGKTGEVVIFLEQDRDS